MEARCSLARSLNAEMLVVFTSESTSGVEGDNNGVEDAEWRASDPRGGVVGGAAAATDAKDGADTTAAAPFVGKTTSRDKDKEEEEAEEEMEEEGENDEAGLVAMTGERRAGGGGGGRGRGGETVE